MHGLINKGLQAFLTETYGRDTWAEVSARAGLPPEGFEALLNYDPDLTRVTLDAAVSALRKPQDTLLEDLGTHLVSHPTMGAVRRLLRFGGEDFADFMDSLDELPGRARLAVPNLRLPDIETREVAPHAYEVKCRWDLPGFGLILAGLLRAMADDYGALVLIDWQGADGREGRLTVRLLEGDFAEGREFELSRERRE